MKKRLLSILLTLMLLLTLVPTGAMAGSITGAEATINGVTYKLRDGILRVTGSGECNDLWKRAFAADEVIRVVFENGITGIDSEAFKSCKNLTSATIMSSVTYIGDSVFKYCPSLTGIYVAEANPNYSSVDGVLYNKNSATLICCPQGKTGEVVIPWGTAAIGHSAFSLCFDITSVVIPDSVTSIARYAFEGCSSLRSITIPEGVTVLNHSAFTRCSSLESIKLPASLTYIDYQVFSGSGLKSITIPKGVTTVEASAFSYCSELESIVIPASVTKLGGDVFNRCTNLTNIYYVGTQAQWAALSAGTGVPETAQVHYLNTFFSDVAANAYYIDAVVWAVDRGVTGGYTDGTFRPQNTCTRAQIVTFLWRANGCPEPTSTSCTFTDVAPGAYYYKAVLWAVENGITGGYNATTFGSNDTVTRAQAMTFLWRAADKPAAPDGTVNTFADVSSTSYYYNAVLWAVANGITGGYNATTFGSNDGCTRGQIVTFLYRSMK